MPDTSRDCEEKKKIHNGIEKKRKDKLKIALDDMRKFLPASVTIKTKLSHHEVLLKAIEYMKELEVENKKLLLGPSDDIKGEIINDLKIKVEECHKEIGNLKTIIEKNCASAHSIDLVQSWKSKEKASKACQAGGSSTPYIDCSSVFKNILMENNKKQKKGFTIAQRLNQVTESSNTDKQPSILTDSNLSKSRVTLDYRPQINEICMPVDVPHDSVIPNLTNKDSNAIILCFNDKFVGTNSNMQINSLSLVTSHQIEVTTNTLANNSLALVSNLINPVSTLPILPFLSTGISHFSLSAVNSEVLIDDSVLPGKPKDSHQNKVDMATEKKESKRRKCWDKNLNRFKVLHCCNWYWRNLRWKRKVLEHITRRKIISSTSSAETQTPKIPNGISKVASRESVENIESVPKEKDPDGNKDHSTNTETFDNSISNSSKSNKPIWVVAKNMTESEIDSSGPKDCDIGNNSLSNKTLSEHNSKVQSNLMNQNQFEAVPFGCHNNSHQKSDYHEISSLLLNPISTFPELYERNTAVKAVDQSFLEDTNFYGTGVPYLNEDNDLQFEIEDMFPQPSTSPFASHVSFEKTKHKDGRKDFINFSFHNEILNSFPLTDTFAIQSSCNSIDKSSCINFYKQTSFQNGTNYPSTIYSNNCQHGSMNLSNVELALPKTTSTIYSQFNSMSIKPPILNASDKNGYSKVSNANCMFDNLEKISFSDNTCSRISNKENKTFNPELKFVQNNPYAISHFDTSGVSIFNPYSNYNYDKMWTHNSSMSFLPPKPNPSFHDVIADIPKNNDTSYPFNNHISSFPMLPTDKNRCFSLKNKTSSNYLESGQTNGEDRTVESSKFQNPLNDKEKEKTCLNEEFPLSGQGVTKVVYTVSHQISTSTKLWNPDHYALNSKPFSFYPLSYNDNVPKTVFNTKNSGSERISESMQTKIIPQSGTFGTDHFSNSLAHNDGFKSNPPILSFVPPIKSSFSCVESDVTNHHLSASNLASNFYPVSSNELYTKPSEIAGNWPKNSSNSVKIGSSNFNPFFTSSNMSDNSENNLFRYQTSPISNVKTSTFSSGNLNSTKTSLNSTMSKSSSSLKRSASNATKSSKRLNKGTPQEFFTRSQKTSYYGNYSSQNSYNASDLLVGAFDRPTYLTGEEQFIPPYNSSEQTSDLNLNNLFVPHLPSHQPNDVRLNLYQNQCSSGLSTTAPTKTLSNSRFSSALPSIHHFGISNIFNDFSHPLPLGVDANNLSLKVSQTDSFVTSPHYYRENVADVSVPVPSSGLLEANYYPPHVPNIFNHAMKQTNSLSKNSMSINNLLGN